MNTSFNTIRRGRSLALAALSLAAAALISSTAQAQTVVANAAGSDTVTASNAIPAPAATTYSGSTLVDEPKLDFKDKFELGLKDAFKNAWVDVNGISYHFKREPKHNERNWGVGLTFPLSEKTAVAVGSYKNSNWRQTTYAWYEYTPWTIGPVKVGFLGGGVTGYRSGNNVMPAAGLLFTTRSDKVGFNVVCLPPVMCAASVSFKVW